MTIGNPTVFANFAIGQYFFNGANYPNVGNWIAAMGGTFTRASTATYFNSLGLLSSATSGELRFDHDPVTLAAKGILIEGERTNAVDVSNDFSDAGYTKDEVTISAAAADGPDGTASMTKIIESVNNAEHRIFFGGTGLTTIETAYTFSVYLKAGERTSASVQMSDSATGAVSVTADLSAGTVGLVTNGGDWTAGSATITHVGNDIYRVTITGTLGAGGPYQVLPIISLGTYDGDGTSGLYTFGWQAETAAFASSYIPTTTVAVTRAADALASGISETAAGVTYARADTFATAGFPRIVGTNAGGGDAYLFFEGSNLEVGIFNGAASLQTANAAVANVLSKCASSWDASGRSVCLDGGAIATDANAQNTGSTLFLGSNGLTQDQLYGHISEFALWPIRASDDELQLITGALDYDFFSEFADIRIALRAFLLADANIANMVSGRVFPILMPQDEFRNSIVYTRISGLGDHYLTQASGIARPRYQIDCWSQTAGAANVLANRVKARLDGARGDFEYGSNDPPDAVEVLGAFFTDEREDYDPESKLYRVSRDYFIWHREF